MPKGYCHRNPVSMRMRRAARLDVLHNWLQIGARKTGASLKFFVLPAVVRLPVQQDRTAAFRLANKNLVLCLGSARAPPASISLFKLIRGGALKASLLLPGKQRNHARENRHSSQRPKDTREKPL